MLRAVAGRPLAVAATLASTGHAASGLSRCPHAVSQMQRRLHTVRKTGSVYPRSPRPHAQHKWSSKPTNYGMNYAHSEEILEGTAVKKDSYVTRFEDLENVHPAIVTNLTKKMGLETMTPVQSQTIGELMEGVDIIAQARTGTGKTLAFLIPIINSVLQHDQSLLQRTSRASMRGPDVRALIISPTRELAEQIAVEARKAVQGTGIKVQSAVGGTQKRLGLRRIMTEGCHILVGTPGRLHDILTDRFSAIKVDNLRAFVLDEADRLLDDGFLPDIRQIEGLLPDKQTRHNMLFSATVPREVLSLSRQLLNTNSQFVQTIKAGEAQTHEKIPQKRVMVRGMDNYLPAVLELMTREIESKDGETFKAMVFCNSNAETMLMAEVFAELEYVNSSGEKSNFDKVCQVLEIHSRLSQNQRQQAADMFRKAKSAVLFSSDVSARGMDYPNVTHVIQIGLPRTREYYIHRIGRTGRANKQGEGWLFVDNVESVDFRKRLNGLPIVEDSSLESAFASLDDEAALTPKVKDMLVATRESAKRAPPELKEDTYKAAFGSLGWISNKQLLIDEMNARARNSWGMLSPPALEPGFAMKMGLKNVQGVHYSGKWSRDNDTRFGPRNTTRAPGPTRPGRFSTDRTNPYERNLSSERRRRSSPRSPLSIPRRLVDELD